MAIKQNRSCFFQLRSLVVGGSEMKDISWIISRSKEELSEKNVGDLLAVVDEFICEKTRECYDNEVQTQFIRSIKVRLEERLENCVASDVDNTSGFL